MGDNVNGGGAPSLTVNGLAVLEDTLGRLGFFAPVTIFLGVSMGKRLLSGINNVLGMTLR